MKRGLLQITWGVGVLFVIVSCAGVSAPRTTKEALPETLALVQPTTVQIAYLAREQASEEILKKGIKWPSAPVGTGLIVSSEGHVVTALHVLTGGQEIIANLPFRATLVVNMAYPNLEEKGLKMTGNFFASSFDVVSTDPLHDLVLLKMHENSFSRGFRKSMIGGLSPDLMKLTEMDFKVASLSEKADRWSVHRSFRISPC